MHKQITIVVLVDLPSALKERSLKDNIYLVDTLRTEESEGEGTDRLVTAVNGFYWINRAQACDVTLNWMSVGIGCLPLTLPRSYTLFRSEKIAGEAVELMLNRFQSNNSVDSNNIEKWENRIEAIRNTTLVMTESGEIKDVEVKTLNLHGELATKEDEPSVMNYLQPQIINIRGEAVEKGVIFPALYGSPLESSEGWYWSATVDTNKTGIYSYILDICLFRREDDDIWRPESYVYEGRIKVTNEPKQNGFTHSGMGYLPLL